jgi:hypothetical protein
MTPTMAPTFLKLQDLVLAPPLPALISILMVAGIAYLGWRLARRLQGEHAEPLDVAAGFVVCAAIIAALIHGLALAQLARVAILRVLAWALAATGGLALFANWIRIAATVRREATRLWNAPRFERAGAILALLAVVGLGAAALGPPTDPDSGAPTPGPTGSARASSAWRSRSTCSGSPVVPIRWVRAFSSAE